MGDVDELFVMIYIMAGIISLFFVLDYFWFKPLRDNKKTEKIIKGLRSKRSLHLPKSTGRGIVICIDNERIRDVKLTIITLFRANCQLPVMLFYAGDELSDADFKDLSSFPHVKLTALGPKLDMPLETLRGPQLRAYAVIYSPFEETLMISPDLLFLNNPEYLFSDPHYTNTGALFWRDRKQWSVWDKRTCEWVRRLIPYRKGDNRILDKKSRDFQTSDILLINKSNHRRTLENLWTLTSEWETTYSYLPGDKECYWISAELAKEPYYFVEHYPGAIGEVSMDRLRGDTLHLDPSGRSLALCGKDKRFTDFTHYSLFVANAEWFGDALKGGDQRHLSIEIRDLLNSFAKIYHDL